MTVTLPVHPFYGMTLAVVRHERDQRGRRYVTAEHPAAGHLRLPYEWTDRSAPRPAPTVNGQPVRIGVEGLLALARVIDVALRKNLTRPSPLRHRRPKLSKRPVPLTSAPVEWSALSPTTRRDLLGVWASLVRKTLRPRAHAAAEVPDERQDPAHPSRTPSRRVPAAVDAQAGSRAS